MDTVPNRNRRWVVDVDGGEITRLQSRLALAGSISEGWDDIRDTAANILSQCPDPASNTGTVTGLALGKIQSGKTLSYTALIALAVDNRYRIIVVLAGTKNPLLEQNYARLCHDLEIPSLACPRITPFENPLPGQDDEVMESVLQAGGNILIVMLKHRKRIEDVRAILGRSELNHFPTLIIDDEGDEASLNTQFRTGRRSAIYSSILNLRAALKIHAYIAYTATPQAPLLISGIDALSPDFGVLIQPGEGYCGGSIFFGPDQNRYIREIPANEAGRGQTEGIPFGLRQAIATFIVGAAIRHLRAPTEYHSMLINNSRLRVDHERLQSSVRTLVNSWRDTLALNDTDPALIDLMNTFSAAYNDLRQTVQDPPPWNDVRSRLRQEIIPLEVWMVNSLPLGRDPVRTRFRLMNNILIGGNMLGRGVTIPELAVTYITARAQNETNADTMEQRARWFGYKQRYLDICRLFLTAQLTGDYTELLQHEDDFWESLSRNERQQLSIREWPRILRLDTGLDLQPTRQNVASYKQFAGRGWDTIQTRIITDPQISERNVQTARAFFEEHGGQVRAYANTEYTLIQDCPTDPVIGELLRQLQTAGTDWDNSYVIEYLSRLFLSGRLPTLDVLLMSKGEERFRSLATDTEGHVVPNQINNLMQGATHGARPGEREYYPGDEHIHGDRPQLQVHIVRPGTAQIPVTALALYIPVDERYNMRFVVRAD